MQESSLNLVDLFSSAASIDQSDPDSPIVVALNKLLQDEVGLNELAEMLEYMPTTTSDVQLAGLLVSFAINRPGAIQEPIDIIAEASLSTSTVKKAIVKPSWDTFAKAKPIIVKSSGVFM